MIVCAYAYIYIYVHICIYVYTYLYILFVAKRLLHCRLLNISLSEAFQSAAEPGPIEVPEEAAEGDQEEPVTPGRDAPAADVPIVAVPGAPSAAPGVAKKPRAPRRKAPTVQASPKQTTAAGET